MSSLAGKLDDVIEEFLNSYERDENHSQSSFYDVGLALVFLLFSCYFHGNRLICLLHQRFSTGGTRTSGGMPDVAKWYAKIIQKIIQNYL